MTLSPCHTLLNVIQTRKYKPCRLNKLSTPFPVGAFHLTLPYPHFLKHKHGRSLTVMPWTSLDATCRSVALPTALYYYCFSVFCIISDHTSGVCKFDTSWCWNFRIIGNNFKLTLLKNSNMRVRKVCWEIDAIGWKSGNPEVWRDFLRSCFSYPTHQV